MAAWFHSGPAGAWLTEVNPAFASGAARMAKPRNAKHCIAIPQVLPSISISDTPPATPPDRPRARAELLARPRGPRRADRRSRNLAPPCGPGLEIGVRRDRRRVRGVKLRK